jgi:hypothetical protein
MNWSGLLNAVISKEKNNLNPEFPAHLKREFTVSVAQEAVSDWRLSMNASAPRALAFSMSVWQCS